MERLLKEIRLDRGEDHVKEREDNAIASLDSYRRKWLNKKQRKKDERGCI
jgi:hypothetical protein